MRRLLALLIAALPAAAAAQSAGQMYFDSKADYVINQAACLGSGEVKLTWMGMEESSGDFEAGTGQYDFYAGPTDKTDAFPYCVVDETRRLVDETIVDPASLDRTSAPVSVPIAALVSAAGYDCVSGDPTIYVCVVWKNEAGAVKAYAKGDVALKTTVPDAPTVASVSPGEEALYVKIEAAATGTVEAAELRAAAFDGYTTHYSDWDSDGSVRVGGLTNGVEYTVWAIARSADGNVSSESFPYVPGDPAEVTPVPVLDGWEAYKDPAVGGQDSGGCQAGGAGLLALLGAAALLRLGRRP